MHSSFQFEKEIDGRKYKKTTSQIYELQYIRQLNRKLFTVHNTLLYGFDNFDFSWLESN